MTPRQSSSLFALSSLSSLARPIIIIAQETYQLTVIFQICMNRVANIEHQTEQASNGSLQQIGREMQPMGREELVGECWQGRQGGGLGDGQCMQSATKSASKSAKKGAVQVEAVRDESVRQVMNQQHNPEDQTGSKDAEPSLLQKFNILTHNRWFWIIFGSSLLIAITTIVLVLNFVVFLPKATVGSTSKTTMPLTGESQITKAVTVKDIGIFTKTKEFTALVAYVEPPKMGRLLQESSLPAKLEISNQEMGVTVVGWSPNDFEVRVNPDQILAYFEQTESRLLQTTQTEDRLNNQFAYDDGAALERAIQQLIVGVVSLATEKSNDEIKVAYEERYIGVFDEKTGKYRIQQESKTARRLLLSFTHLLEPVKELMSTYVSQTVKNMKEYGSQIAETAGAVYSNNTVLTYPGENIVMGDLADLNMTRVLQTEPEEYQFEMVSKQAYDNYALCTGPKERRVCDKDGFVDANRGQPIDGWPTNPEVSASYSVASKNSMYVSAS